MRQNASFTVLYPADATSAWRATALLAKHSGPCYLRLGRPSTPIFYAPDEQFEIGKCKVLRITVEDHYAHGGLGDAVLSALAEESFRTYKLAVRAIPHSGKAKELIEKFGISSGHIINAVKSALR